jgi:hypothetical protein
MRYTSTDLTPPRVASFFFSRGTAFAFVLFFFWGGHLAREPVIGQDGHTYEKKAIEEWIKKKVRVLLAFIWSSIITYVLMRVNRTSRTLRARVRSPERT